MLSPLRKLDTTRKLESYKLALGLAIVYTGLLVLLAVPAICFHRRDLAGIVLIPGVLCVLFWGNLVWLLYQLPTPAGRCPKCNYSLFGLAEQRCPECGRPFTFDEVRCRPVDLWFRER